MSWCFVLCYEMRGVLNMRSIIEYQQDEGRSKEHNYLPSASCARRLGKYMHLPQVSVQGVSP
eukprot:6987874-Heterocapsa_arctica.AAC.1